MYKKQDGGRLVESDSIENEIDGKIITESIIGNNCIGTGNTPTKFGKTTTKFGETTTKFDNTSTKMGNITGNIGDATTKIGNTTMKMGSAATKILVHGWLHDGKKEWILRMKDTYLKCKDSQVIICDWSRRSKQGYAQSANEVKKIGSFLGDVVLSLEKCGFPLEFVHCVGHSLGSHICGYAGKHILKMTNRTLGRISGLDPAGPCFDQNQVGLAAADARVVDVYYTDAKIFGSYLKRGKMNFLPNGGFRFQPGCPEIILSHFLSFNSSNLLPANVGEYLLRIKFQLVKICTLFNRNLHFS